MIEQFVPEEACLQCQGCCRFNEENSVWSPSLLHEETEELFKNNILSALILPENKIRLEPLLKKNSFACSFFNLQDNKCKIYSFRPFECQLYPFLINRKGKKIFLAVDLKCPFVEEKIKSREFQEYIDYLVDFFNSPHCQEILKHNQQIIQAYTGVLNLSKIPV